MGRRKRWTITLPKAEGQKIGARMRRIKSYLDTGEIVMMVRTIDESGPLAEHNARNADAALELGDMIISVNGVRGDWNTMLAEFGKESMVVEIERPLHKPIGR